MNKTCPFGYSNAQVDCHDKCVMYEDGCLFKKAIKLYIQNHTPLIMKQPTEEELNRFSELLKETLAKHSAEPIVFKHSDLNVKHDYDEHGMDWWYPHGFDDIAP